MTLYGHPLGISADPPFAAATFQFGIDDVLVACSNGITGAENREHELGERAKS
jgi:Stage II sporulation protein E (SpoIIE)